MVGGTDVYELRRRLAAALPRASRRQIVQDQSILHTTLARVVAPPRSGAAGAAAAASAAQRQRQRALKQAQRQRAGRRQQEAAGTGDEALSAGEEAAVLLQAAVDRMTRELCGLEAVMDHLW